MNIIVCIDKNNGMSFNNRRQSQDGQLISKIVELTSDSRLLMNEYTADMFSDYSNIIVSNNFLADAQSGDFCFIENSEIPTENIEDIYVFNWNRNYPADKYFSLNLEKNSYKIFKKLTFVGNSHKKITLEIYRRIQK